MRISIITNTYNSSTTIADCITSIAMQTHQDIEHIIIDGHSNDNTIDIIKSLPNKVVTLISEPDNGIYDGLNKGICAATGDIIGFLHSDDILASTQTLENVVRAFSTPFDKNNKMAEVVYGDLIFVDRQDTTKIIRYWKSQPYRPNLLQRGWMPPHPTLFFRREVYEKHGLFNINLKCSADYDYILRVFKDLNLSINYIPEVITKMRAGGISTKGFKNLLNKKIEDYWVLKHNNMPFPLWILIAKSISKIPQIIFRERAPQEKY